MKKLTLAMILLWSVIALVLIAVFAFFLFRSNRVSASDGDGASSNLSGGTSGNLILDTSFPSSGTQNIDLDLSSENVEIYLSDGDDILVQHYSNKSSNEAVLVRQSGDTLHIESPKRYFFSFSFSPKHDLIRIYFPRSLSPSLSLDLASGNISFMEEMRLRELDVNLASGRLLSSFDIHAPSANLEVVSGTLRLSALYASEFSVHVVSGKIDIGGLTGSGNIEAVSGNIKLDQVQLGNDLDIEVVSGKISVALAGDPSFYFNADILSGTVNTYFNERSSNAPTALHKTHSATVGDNPTSSLDVDVMSGSVSITKAS